ncbi:MAG TPA: hypothetical protein VHN37_09920 [Actinomycetota bacterium]|nr:hypothetical protein [Actinomycetota bacterium]
MAVTYVVDHGGGRASLVNADFYNYWPGKPYVTFWKHVRGADVVVATIRLEAATTVRPR